MADGCRFLSDMAAIILAISRCISRANLRFTVNHARAMRIAEIMNDFRSLQYYLAAIHVNPLAEDYYLEGYSLIRACIAEGQAVLANSYTNAAAHPSGDEEAEKSQLKLIIVDASVRRFLCQRAYMRAVAAQRWANARTQILGGHRPHAGNLHQLQQLDAQLRTELGAITDGHVLDTLQSHDVAQGKFIDDDPSLEILLQQIQFRQ
ncbi:hypothetical protein BT63DRAFT_482304 [Microthyrium microscopicum]|uniref:Uncharacterized protein n=1 Tax=Microthyrium microscopicum TaxID=703497 RepID=A0A6A6U259_9PEZI|nr:hypothetical protein BT63DRAFT_482304 [Microthyrium microscopicum]